MPRNKEYDEDVVAEKAMQVFWDNGYKATSVRALEQAMGINQFSIYSSFKSKQGLFLEVLKKYKELNEEVILKTLIESNGDLEDIRKFYFGFIDSVKGHHKTNGCLFANTTAELGSSDPDVAILLKGHFAVLEGLFQELLIKAKERGNIKKEADTVKLSRYLVTTTEGLTITAKIQDRESLEDFVEVVINSLKV